MGSRWQDKENAMNCHTCGNDLMKVTTDLPFKTDIHAIIIIKNLPVLQCGNCSEYLIEDQIMQRVDDIISNMNRGAEVEILNFAA